jgi:hypothetical protein
MDEMRSLFDTAVNRGFFRDIDRHILTDIIVASIIGLHSFRMLKLRDLMKAVLNLLYRKQWSFF